MTVRQYITELDRQYATGLAREHSYRPALQQLLAARLPALVVTNEPARIDCGAPDFIITRRADNIPVAFVEAKDIGDSDLDGRRQHREQFERYRASLDTIVFTDYLDFHVYAHGEWQMNVRLGQVQGDRIKAAADAEGGLNRLTAVLAGSAPQTITSSATLARIMAGKARLLADTIRRAFDERQRPETRRQLQGQYEAFRRVLIHDLTAADFADIYAQTITYGMFSARLHDTTPDDFSRQEAATLIPKSNPFLRKIFQSIAGYDIDDCIEWIVDDLAATFAATDMPRIMRHYGSGTQRHDPIVHFYEDFLAAYNPSLRKAKGVWYTPEPVVRFIVRAVDHALRCHFALAQGLADHSMVNRKTDRGMRQFHRVQVLDPATGTGTFLAEVISHIHRAFDGQQGLWPGYVNDHLLPRLNGFELLMASYAVAHVKLDYLLHETGVDIAGGQRLRVFLTNSLEEHHPDTGSLFAQWLSNEANEANTVKRDTPVMVMLGNPPYSGASANKGQWIMELMDTYKREPGGQAPLKERNPKWLNDDYVKFIRLAQYYVERNGESIVAYINPHGFLDNPTFRGMRWSLMHTFDHIYTIDLHGNAKKKETAPDGGKDENVFDIMQGVSVNIMVKTGRKTRNALAEVWHADLYGTRQHKYDVLERAGLPGDTAGDLLGWRQLRPAAPQYFFVPKDFALQEEYDRGFAINELFVENSVGIVTTQDDFLCRFDAQEVYSRISDFISLSAPELAEKYNLKENRDWTFSKAKKDIGLNVDKEKILPLAYKPFDTRFLYFTGISSGIVAWPRFRTMKNLLEGDNLALVVGKQCSSDWRYVFVTNTICSLNLTGTAGRYGAGYTFPLYIKDGDSCQANFRPQVIAKLTSCLGEAVEPLELFDYIYAVLHSLDYRERYHEFLKIDFPRIPYPADAAVYHRLAAIGTRLRGLHLMTGSDSWTLITTYPRPGSDVVECLRRDGDKVWINDEQYFGQVPDAAWDAWVGGYQPARKWLKDRMGRKLSSDDLIHWQRIVVALDATARIMQHELTESPPTKH